MSSDLPESAAAELASAPPPQPPPPPQARRWQRIFLGPYGPRAGWRLLLFLAVLLAISYVLRQVAHQLPRPASGVWRMLYGYPWGLLGLILAVLVMARLERRPFKVYGLPWRGALGGKFWVGALWGVLMLSALLGVLRLGGWFYYGHLALDARAALGYGLFWALFMLFVGLMEEFTLRGYPQYTLASGIGFWPAALLLSVLFGLFHRGNPGETWIGVAAAGLIGLFFCLTLQRTGDLWFAVGLHAGWNWGETFLYGVANSGMRPEGGLLSSHSSGPAWLSGGTVGPEGSVLVLLEIVVVWWLFARLYPEKKYLLPKDTERPPAAEAPAQTA